MLSVELVSDAESDGVSFCSTESTDPGCINRQKVQDGFITAAAYASDPDGAWVQVSVCLLELPGLLLIQVD